MGRSINTFLGSYSKAVNRAFQTGSHDEVMGFYSENYSSPARGSWILADYRQQGNIKVSELVSKGEKAYGRKARWQEFSEYFSGLDSLDRVSCKIHLIERVETEEVVVTVHFTLDGTDRSGALFQDRHQYRWHLVDESGMGPGFDWKIVRDELVEGNRVSGNANSFAEASLEAIGIDYHHQRDPDLNIEFSKHIVKSGERRLRFAVIQHAMGGVSSVDYNNDDRPDIFFADGRRSRLYRNDGPTENGLAAFSDVTNESGLDGIGHANAGLFADVDNDGFKDLFVVRYLATNQLFHNNGNGTFTDRSAEMGLDLLAPSASALFLDYDRDGFLDLYVAVYGNAFEQIPTLPFFAENAGKNRLYRNVTATTGDAQHGAARRFIDVTDSSGTGDRGWSLAVASADYDQNGYPDLLVANDFGRKNLYKNEGDGTFSEVAKDAGVLDFSGGMGVAFGDFDSDGTLDLYTSNIQSNQRWFGEDMTLMQYMRNVVRTKWLLLDAKEYWTLYSLLGDSWRELGKMTGEGNSLFRNNEDGTFDEQKQTHTNRAGWGWSVAFLDVDNDADLDIYAANGWISNRPDSDL